MSETFAQDFDTAFLSFLETEQDAGFKIHAEKYKTDLKRWFDDASFEGYKDNFEKCIGALRRGYQIALVYTAGI